MDLWTTLQKRTLDISALGEDHLVVRCAENWNLLMEEKSSDHKFQVAINVVKLKDEAWLNDVLGVNLNAESIIEEFKLMNKNYPLLRIVGKSLNSHYCNLKNNTEFDGNPNTNDDIVEYISLCDNKGGEGSV